LTPLIRLARGPAIGEFRAARSGTGTDCLPDGLAGPSPKCLLRPPGVRRPCRLDLQGWAQMPWRSGFLPGAASPDPAADMSSRPLATPEAGGILCRAGSQACGLPPGGQKG